MQPINTVIGTISGLFVYLLIVGILRLAGYRLIVKIGAIEPDEHWLEASGKEEPRLVEPTS
ncbi:MAG: hypothetical protein ACR2GP_04870 [Burkholderiaceae bacterium]